MKKLFSFLPGIFMSPKKTYGQLANVKNLEHYFFWMIGVSILLLVLNQFLPVHEPVIGKTVAEQKIALFLKTVDTYALLWGFLLGFFIPLIINAMAKLFSKKGSYKKLYVLATLTAVVTYIPLTLLQYIDYFYPNGIFTFLQLGVCVWGLILEILLLSALYGISKKKAFGIIVVEGILTVLLFLGAFIYFIMQ